MKCWRTGKHRHGHSAKAAAQLKSIARVDHGYDGEVYLCEFCHDWHVGRKGKRPRRSTSGIMGRD